MRVLYIFIVVAVYACGDHIEAREKAELWSMIKSDNADKIIEATIEIQKAGDTTMFDAILYNADDPRITHEASHKGMSVYQVKMNALRIITGITPPNTITYQVDTTIINFYKKRIKGK